MPIRRRLSKRKGDPEALRVAWVGVLESGFDFFEELRDQGVAVDDAGRPDLVAARAAWQLYGRGVLAARSPQLGPPWGLRQFGRPGAAAADTSHAC